MLLAYNTLVYLHHITSILHPEWVWLLAWIWNATAQHLQAHDC
jgi:hypothetical protein